MDFSFFRLYDEDGSPLSSDTYFPFDRDGLSEGDPIFIVGNPGSTSRLQTVAELEYRRDVSDRFLLETVRKRMAVLDVYIRENPEIAEQYDLRNQYFSLSNTEKAYEGQLHGLGDPVILAKRADTEADFREAINADPTLQDLYGGLVDRMAELQELKRVSGTTVADLVRVGLEKCSPLAGTASNEGRLSAFSMAYEAVCDECGDLILRLAGEHCSSKPPPG